MITPVILNVTLSVAARKKTIEYAAKLKNILIQLLEFRQIAINTG
jgi:hypothetical protein